MGLPAEELRITLTLAFEDVQWPQVLEILSKRSRLSFLEANKVLKDFLSRFLQPFHFSWFRRRALSYDDNRLLAAVCECHGADTVILTLEKPVRAGPLHLRYNQAFEFSPGLRKGEHAPEGQVTPTVELTVLGRRHRVQTASEALFLYSIVALTGILSYVVLVGALLYSLSVFLVFIEQPAGVTEEATTNAAVGLALLCFLVVCAAVFGRAVSNIAKLLHAKVRGRAA